MYLCTDLCAADGDGGRHFGLLVYAAEPSANYFVGAPRGSLKPDHGYTRRTYLVW